MKLLVVLACLGAAVATGASVGSRNLHDDFEDFASLIPVDEIVELATTYADCDKEVQAIANYSASPEFVNIVDRLTRLPVVSQIARILEGLGLQAFQGINDLRELLGLPPLLRRLAIIPRTYAANCSSVTQPGYRALVNKVKSLIPEKALQDLFVQKQKTSRDFVDFLNLLKDDKFLALIEEYRSTPVFKEYKANFLKVGVDIEEYVDYVKGIFKGLS